MLGVALAALTTTAPAHADGEITVRGAYYLERATRVVQPMVDAHLEIGPDTELEVHTLVDAITSASAAAGAAQAAFTERRYEGGAAVSRRMGQYQCGVAGRFSREPDYRSLFGSARCQVELAQRNTTLGIALALGRDHLSNAGAQDELAQIMRIEGDLTSTLVSTSFTQILSPLMLAGVTYDFIYLDGFLENPYRRVPAGGGGGSLVSERVPDSRLRHALFGHLRRFVPQTGTGVIAGYRIYLDDWGVQGHTPEIRLMQELAPGIDMHARYRFHWQSAADFYAPVYDSGNFLVTPHITDDVKLSRFTTHTMGVELETALSHLGFTGAMGDARLDLVFEYVVQNNRFGNAVAAQTAITVPFSY